MVSKVKGRDKKNVAWIEDSAVLQQERKIMSEEKASGGMKRLVPPQSDDDSCKNKGLSTVKNRIVHVGTVARNFDSHTIEG